MPLIGRTTDLFDETHHARVFAPGGPTAVAYDDLHAATPELAAPEAPSTEKAAKAAPTFTVGHAGLQDFVLSPDGHTIYVADNDGMVRAYDALTHQQTDAWRLGSDLGGIDITPDGKTLVAVEDRLVFHAQGKSFDETVSHQIYALNLSTGAVKNHIETINDYYPDGFFDVATTADGSAIISGDDQWGALTTVNLGTGRYTDSKGSYYPSSLRATASHQYIAVMENGISDASLNVFTSGQGVTASHGGYEDGVDGYNYGVVAIDEAKGFVAQGLGSTVNIYNLALDFQFDLNSYKALGLGSVHGLAFSANGKTLYILDSSNDAIVAVNTTVWERIGTYGLGGAEVVDNYYGNGLVASADGSYLAFVSTDGVRVLDITKGGDQIAGTTGAETMAGGAGNDAYTVNAAGDVVTEAEGAGYDTVRASVSHTLGANVEALQLVGDALNGVGNALANTLTGNALGNRLEGLEGRDGLYGGGGDDKLYGGGDKDVLDGGAGADTLNGGKGSDRYVVDVATDVIVEAAKGGVDTVEAKVSYTLAANLETLLLAGSGNFSGAGNEGDNRIVGNIGDNLLTGLGGDDVLEAGGGGKDRMVGGEGADTFRFNQLDPSGASFANADSIADMRHAEGDRIDLSRIDANINAAGDQAFSFLGAGAFTGKAGELQILKYSGNTYVQADINGDKLVDFVIKLDGSVAIDAGDFVL